MTAWAVNLGGYSYFLDANSPGNTCLAPGTGNLSTDPDILSLCGSDVGGTVTDGVTQLLLRVVSGLQGTACYSITSAAPPDQGTISAQVVATQASGGLDYGFSYYQSPDGYGDPSASRTVQVQFAFAPSGGFSNTTTIPGMLSVIRPPLVLIHGLWSDQGAWSEGAANWFRSGPYYASYAADYGSTNASNFSANFPSVQTWVATGLQQARDLGFAATQADVVGHSMGGILTRLYAGSSQFLRNDNYNLGDVHRLVTLDTPHAGASLANLIVSLSANSLVFATIGPALFGLVDKPLDQGAICDLSENSPALQGLNGGTNLTSQVVTGTGGPAGTSTAPAPYFSPVEGILTQKLICAFGTCAYIFPQNVVNGFRFLQQNDQIVSLTSQQALGAGASYQTNYIHTEVEKEADVATWTLNLLDGPRSGFMSSLLGVNSNGLGNPLTVTGTSLTADRSDYSNECIGLFAPLEPSILDGLAKEEKIPPLAQTSGRGQRLPPAIKAHPPDPRVQITSPANGQQFAPGTTLTVMVQITSPLTVNTGWVGTTIPGAGSLVGTNYTANSYQASLVIPTTFSGPATLTPAILDSGTNPFLGVSITINVVPVSAPLSLTVQQPYTHLASVPSSASIFVKGNYPDDLQLNLTSAATGTTYTSSNTNVLTVDLGGNVQAVAFGTAVVTVQNNGLKAFAIFVIESATSPLPPHDLTNGMNISLSGIQLNRNTGFYVQTINITNSLTVPTAGPLYFMVMGLPRGVTLSTTGGGLTRAIAPVGTPYIKLQLADGLTLQPGAGISLTLQFLNPSRARISYTPKVFRTLATP
jgi:pimeloyl-ACP methyl ester carboxylesterase